MTQRLSRRSFALASVAAVAAPAFIRSARADEPMRLRLSLDTAPSHLRNVSMKDYLGKVEAASGGKIKTEMFESGQLYPDLEVGKALIQGQVEMAAPGSWTITGIVSDADCFQLPVLYGQPIDLIHRVIDGKPGQYLNTPDPAEAALARARALSRSRFPELVQRPTSRSRALPTSRA